MTLYRLYISYNKINKLHTKANKIKAKQMYINIFTTIVENFSKKYLNLTEFIILNIYM